MRRHLDPSQRASVAVELEPVFAIEAAKRMHRKPVNSAKANLRQPNAGKATDQAAAVVGVSGAW